MTPNPTPRRTPAASAAILVAVLLLFGAATFVAGLAVGGSRAVAEADPSADPSVALPSEAGTPGPTPILETVSCAEPSECPDSACKLGNGCTSLAAGCDDC